MFIYQFAKNVYWPKAYTTGDFTIGIYGSKDLYNLLNTSFKDKMNGSQKIKFAFYESASDISDCHLLFVKRICNFYPHNLCKGAQGPLQYLKD